MSSLTLTEARAIARHRGYGQRVPDSLYRLALDVLEASKPVIIYEPIDWFEDDANEAATDSALADRAATVDGERWCSDTWDT